jgi:excisionase family DNA binding protein
MSTTVSEAATQGDELLTLQEACVYLKLSSATLRRKVRNRQVEHVRMDGVLRFWRSRLDAYLSTHTVVVVEPPAPSQSGPTARSRAAAAGRKGRAA